MELSGDRAVKAFLATLAHQESGGRYDVIVGGDTFNDYSAHPNVYVPGMNSTAAGAYQFTNSTWNGVSAALGLADFSPQSQDLGAIHLLDRIGAINKLLSGDLKGAIFLAGKRWDAFPVNESGASISGGNRSLSTIINLYNRFCSC